jgi:hypothetical protein
VYPGGVSHISRSRLASSPQVRRTLRISCEAVPPSVQPAGAQGGTSARSTGAALSFVSCIRLFGRPGRLSWADTGLPVNDLELELKVDVALDRHRTAAWWGVLLRHTGLSKSWKESPTLHGLRNRLGEGGVA